MIFFLLFRNWCSAVFYEVAELFIRKRSLSLLIYSCITIDIIHTADGHARVCQREKCWFNSIEAGVLVWRICINDSGAPYHRTESRPDTTYQPHSTSSANTILISSSQACREFIQCENIEILRAPYQFITSLLRRQFIVANRIDIDTRQFRYLLGGGGWAIYLTSAWRGLKRWEMGHRWMFIVYLSSFLIECRTDLPSPKEWSISSTRFCTVSFSAVLWNLFSTEAISVNELWIFYRLLVTRA